MVAEAGAVPCPQTTVARSSARLHSRIGRSPPGPLRCGSTTWRTKPAGTAASNALPPRASTLIPAAEASQWVLATMPKSPVSSGRVVNTLVPPSDVGDRGGRHEVAGDGLGRLPYAGGCGRADARAAVGPHLIQIPVTGVLRKTVVAARRCGLTAGVG